MRIRYAEKPGEGRDGPKSHSEDFFYVGFNGTLKVAVGDWATNMLGGKYDVQEPAKHMGTRKKLPGGVIGRTAAMRTVERSMSTGRELVEEINAALVREYRRLEKRYPSMEGWEEDSRKCFPGFIAHALVEPEETAITSVGDVKLAADGVIVAGEDTVIQKLLNRMRRLIIERKGIDPKNAYEELKPFILRQYAWNNDMSHPLGYPTINGNPTPREGVVTRRIKTPRKLLLYTDGYVDPEVFTIEGLEKQLAHAYRIDPHRYRHFPAVGSLQDDRTAIEVDTSDWGVPRVEKVSI